MAKTFDFTDPAVIDMASQPDSELRVGAYRMSDEDIAALRKAQREAPVDNLTLADHEANYEYLMAEAVRYNRPLPEMPAALKTAKGTPEAARAADVKASAKATETK